MAGINPYQRDYGEAVRYLIDHGYLESYQNSSRGLYRMTNKGIEEILGNP
jgi:predicted transcriptional regulator